MELQSAVPRLESAVSDSIKSALYTNGHSPPVSSGTVVLASTVAFVGLGLAGLLSARRAPTQELARRDPVTESAKDLRDGAAILASSVILDSALEHYRGNYANRAMYAAPTVAGVTIATALDTRLPRPARSGVFGVAAAVGLAGLGFHFYNILKRPGGLSWNNLFYAAPLLAPGALTLSGVLGLAASRIEKGRDQRGVERTRQEVGRGLAILLSGGLIATVAEAALLHFRGAFHNPAMYAPVTLPPAAAVSLAAAGVKPSPARLRLAHSLLVGTALLGPIGTALHIFGVHRNMGGWRNWSQNLFVGPPLPAPPSFTGLALAGLGALRLIKTDR